MKKTINLAVTSPCSQNWETFAPTKDGRFCNSCSKDVVDFTTMSDEEIIHFFESKPTYMCGRFRADQLRIYQLPVPRINPGFSLLKAGLLSALVVMAGQAVSAQSVVEKPKTEQTEQRKRDQSEVDESKHPVKGVVTSAEDGTPIPGVNIVLKGSELGIITNADGMFVFPKPLKSGDVLLFSFMGLKSKEYVVSKESHDSVTIKMEMDIIIMGKVAVDGPYEEKPSALQRLKFRLKNFF